ncbi:hypothetical protein [Natrinema altunense]|uniref:Uncharacterized protein n=1 Tax=Natrinema altunense (strain JCM 12890 / CGMCC 1.3731 / AJ2) TaxID=1227494 RepID=L9ZKE3_NATA2|nr:hypothetical protein [Natrinema altunense]ELY86834.1 hypothetical protein C485_07957 [Natrinema altunense JCM 12890]
MIYPSDINDRLGKDQMLEFATSRRGAITSSESVSAELGRGSTVGEAVDELRGRLSGAEREV